MTDRSCSALLNPDPQFWSGKRVLLTGHTGFKGGWLALWLERLGATVSGLSLAPDSRPNLFDEAKIGEVLAHAVIDIRDANSVRESVRGFEPDIVFHLAAQALVRPSYKNPLATFETNFQGTANLLDALRYVTSCRAAVVITTDKVYRNDDSLYPFRESDVVGGHDPYSASKAAAELVAASYRDSFLKALGVAVATARAGNVVGGGDWSEDRLIPDAVRAWASGTPLAIRNPAATRPWQHVLEPLCGYLILAERLYDGGSDEAWNFGPEPSEAATVQRVVELLAPSLSGLEAVYDDLRDQPKEAKWLALETVKSKQRLGVRPRWGLTEGLERTASWYAQHHAGHAARNLCLADIAQFEAGG